MSTRSWKNAAMVAALVSAGILAIAAGRPRAAVAQSAAEPAKKVLAGEHYKNVQVLKDIPADQLIPGMQFISASLGVDCEYCHVTGAMDKDDKKPKQTARSMMRMMMAINRENFEGKREVTCYSCHRGSAKPVSVPVISEAEASVEPVDGTSKSVEAPPAASEVFAKYLAAVGGAEALREVRSRVEKGTLTLSGQKFPVEIYAQAPNRRVSILHLHGTDSITGFDGTAGWLSFPGRATHRMSAGENEAARMDADMLLVIHLPALYAKYDVAPGGAVDGQQTWLVTGEAEDRPPLRLYFSRATGLLVRVLRFADSPFGLNPTQIDFADYRDSGNVKIPYRWTQARPGSRFTVQLETAEANVPVAESHFVIPAESPAH